MLNPADPVFVQSLADILPKGVLRAPEPRHLEEPRGRWNGQAGILALPRTTAEVATIVRHCAKCRVGIVPWGGGTGLVGGQIAPPALSTVLLSLERMTALRGVWPQENAMAIEAGATLARAQQAASDVDRLFPLSLTSEGTATIGGNLATNAGGVNVVRYGNTRDLCLGIEAVLADGSTLHGSTRLRKDNTGYDLRHLLIGSEGTLGIITAASLRLMPIPAGQGSALMVVPDPAAALALLALAQDHTSGGVMAFELINRTGLDFLTQTMPDLRQPFDAPPDWFVLIDIGVPKGLSPESALEAIFEDALSRGLVTDGLIAASESQRNDFWQVRESIPEANRLIGAVASHDISLPLSAIPDFIRSAGEKLGALGDWRINCFGHLGDGNLHYNVFPQLGRNKADHVNQRDAVTRLVHDLVNDLGGSVSAEHGIGRLKTEDLIRYSDPTKVAAMRAIKAALDPLGIMNPGAVLT
ncbi:MAG: FAD-binding oxidoreductase [Gemmobacter sp.]|nr:FAD-binding oxidoreductase [Gemmobacter sp.]